MSDLKRLKIHRGKIVKTEKDEDDDLDSFDSLGAPEAEPSAFLPEPVAFSSQLASLVSPTVEEKARVSQPPLPTEDEEARIDLSALAASQPAAAAEALGSAPGTSPPAAAAVAFPAGLPVAPPPESAAAFPAGSPVSSPAPPGALDDDLEALVARRSLAPPAALIGFAKEVRQAAARAPAWAWFALGVLASGLLAAALFLGGEEPEDSAQAALSAAQTSPSASPAAPAPGNAPHPGSIGSVASSGPASASDRERSFRAAGDRYRQRARAYRPEDRGGERESTSRGATATGDDGSGEDRSIDSLLDSALGSGSASSTATSSSPARESGRGAVDGVGLALMPSRQEVTRAMSEVLPSVRRCAEGRTGIVTADVTVRSTGRVSSVRIRGAPFARTPAGRCMEQAVRGARFPRFRKSVFRVTYPFQI